MTHFISGGIRKFIISSEKQGLRDNRIITLTLIHSSSTEAVQSPILISPLQTDSRGSTFFTMAGVKKIVVVVVLQSESGAFSVRL